jgi:TP901 family phage tail tape measure protein
MAEQIASLYAKISADTDGFEKGLSKAHSSLTSFGGLLSGIATGGVVVAGAAIAGLGAVIGTGISKAAGFEQSFADLAASMDATTQEIQPLKKLIMDLGLDPKLKVSTDEAASAVTNLVKNGLTMQQVLDGAARSTVLLANATGADFGMAADIATDVMQQFNISAAQMDSAVNGILGVTQASKFGIQGYKDAISMAGGVASSVSVSFEDFNAVIAGTAFNFSGGSDAGTSFKTFLQRLVPSTQEATDEMKKLGIITADGTNRFFDANGQMRSMTVF